MYKNQWFLSTGFISLMFALWFLIIPLIVGVILLLKQKNFYEDLEEVHQQALLEKVKEKNLEFKKLENNQKQLIIEWKREAEEEIKKKEHDKQEEWAKKELVNHLKMILNNKIITSKMFEYINDEEQRLKELDKNLQEKYLKLREMENSQKQLLMIWKKEQEENLTKLDEEKQKEWIKKELTQQVSLIKQYYEIMERLLEKANRINQFKNKINVTLKEKFNILAETERSHQQKLVTMTKERELYLSKREKIVEEKEKVLYHEMLNTQKRFNDIELAHMKKIDLMTKVYEEEIMTRESDVKEREQALKNVQKEIESADRKLQVLNQLIVTLDDELLYQSFGFYETKYDLEDSEEYKEFLKLIRVKQKELVKGGFAIEFEINWRSEVSEDKAYKLAEKNKKLAIRSFNNECDVIINKVKYNNVDSCEKRIRTAFEHINQLNRHNQLKLTEHYLSLKLEELFLAYEYAEKKQEEREEQLRINEQIREERRVQKELDEQLKKIEKEHSCNKQI